MTCRDQALAIVISGFSFRGIAGFLNSTFHGNYFLGESHGEGQRVNISVVRQIRVENTVVGASIRHERPCQIYRDIQHL